MGPTVFAEVKQQHVTNKRLVQATNFAWAVCAGRTVRAALRLLTALATEFVQRVLASRLARNALVMSVTSAVRMVFAQPKVHARKMTTVRAAKRVKAALALNQGAARQQQTA